MDHRIYLKIKLKSLAAEAKIIRREEKKGGEFREGLYRHRIDVVRHEARHTILAYNFIRGVSYKQTEPKTNTPINTDKVKAMVKRYGKQRGPIDWDNYKAQQDQFAIDKEAELKELDAWFTAK